MTNTIAGTYTTLVTLGAAIDNPTTITQTGLLTGGLQLTYQGLTVVNAGSITGSSAGVYLQAGDSLTNQSGGVISGHNGIKGRLTDGTVVNAGSIAGSAGYGIYLTAGGNITNQRGGVISGSGFGIYDGGHTVVNVVNAGNITGGRTGIYLFADGSVTNQSGGTISGSGFGIYGNYRAVTVVNAGTIIGGSDAVRFAAGYTNRLVIGPGAVFSGAVTGGNTIGAAYVSTLELASAGSVGTLSGLGTQFVDFAQVTVDAGAQWILAGSDIVSSGVTLTNAGTLIETLALAAGGVLSNASTGTVVASDQAAIYGAPGGAATVVNAGVIAGEYGAFNGIFSRGILLTGGGSVTNQSGGTISGYYGIFSQAGGVTVVNAGSITGVSSGIYLNVDCSITNQSSGSIVGNSYGIISEFGALTVVNAGSIAGQYGIRLDGGGSVTNQTGGTISGGYGILGLAGPITVVNAGAIIGNIDAVKLSTGYASRLVIDPGAMFSGQVNGGNAIGAAHVSTLELAADASAGTLSGLGTQFINFAQIAVDAGAQWTLTGSNTLASGETITNAGTLMLSDATLSGAAALINDGAIVLDPSSMTIASLTGTGSFTIQAGSTLDVTGTIASTETIVFAGSGASLLLGAPDSAAGAVTGFAAGDTIDLAGINPASVSDTDGEVTFTGGSFPLTAATSPTIGPDGNGGTNLVVCFAAGTRIGTPAGEVPVQNLAIGDLVLTAHNGPRAVIWIGNGKVLATRGRRTAATPVIVRKDALADNVPNRDLHVTKAHSLYIDDVLIPVEFLINHRTILWDDRAQEVEIYHVELDSHDVLIANGAPAESFRDDGNRWLFQNARSGWGLPPQQPYAPVLTGGPIVDAIWRRLLDRAGPRDLLPLTDDPDLHLLVDGTRVDAVEQRGSVYVFCVPPNPGNVVIASREIVPSEFGIARDPRSLGVALRRVTVQQGARFMLLDANDERLAVGFHAHEADCNLRWTDGRAELPAQAFAHFDTGAQITLYLCGATQYPDDRTSVARSAA
ncbi:Hint domain-containing protein [Acidisphaera sp. S103]|uniref:Hint domain-containing protein n=1 Tax=Acidisphaera sp. S103 TaxID=1747223 RepID=UPI00131D394B|nr:Hint domain-containing protein [Acidisphaera sp. S103]